MKRTLPLLVNLLPLFLSCDSGEPIVPADREVLRVLDINVWSGLDYKGVFKMGEYESDEVREKRYRALVAQIKELDPDVIGVHEANKLPDYAERLAEDIGYDFFHHVGVGGVRLGDVGLPWNLREGDVILTRRDLLAEFVGRKQLSGGRVGNTFTFHFDDATQILGVKITNRHKPLYVFATHWHSSLHGTPEVLNKARQSRENGTATADEYDKVFTAIEEGANWRSEEADSTIAFIRRVAGDAPYILMGDLNALPNSEEIRKLWDFGMVDACKRANPRAASGYTWDPRTNQNILAHYLEQPEDFEKNLLVRLKYLDTLTPKRVDYIFLKSGPHYVTVKSCRVVMKKVLDGVQASDHYGVFAELRFEE